MSTKSKAKKKLEESKKKEENMTPTEKKMKRLIEDMIK